MAKKSISLKALFEDLRSGMNDAALMEKHDLTAEQLKTVYRKAVERGGITQEELNALRHAAKPPAGSAPLHEPKQPVRQPSGEPPSSGRSPGSVDSAGSGRRKVEGPGPILETKPPAGEVPPPQGTASPEEAAPAETRRFSAKKIIVILVLLVFLVGFIVMVKFLPWWASVAIVIVAGGLTWFLGKYLLKRLFIAPFRMKGKALAGAEAIVHGITAAELPSVDEEEPDAVSERDSLNWYYLDVTITPKDQSEGFTYWEPGELALVRMDANPEEIEEDTQSAAQIHDYRIFSDGSFREDEIYKHPGAQRLQLHVGVKPGETQLQFRYYFELFGNVAIQDC